MRQDGDMGCTAYLVQHGEAEPKTRDPRRGLTVVGRETAERVAAWAARAGLAVQQIRHSGKLRAEQTAAVFAEALRPSRGSVAWPALGPQDDVEPLAEELAGCPYPVMIVGHLPFLARLTGEMLVGDPEQEFVRFRNAGLVGLAREDAHWRLVCVLPPELAIGQ